MHMQSTALSFCSKDIVSEKKHPESDFFLIVWEGKWTTRASNPTKAFDRFSVQNMEASPCYILFSGLINCLFGRHQVNAKTYLCQCSWVHKSQVWHPFTSRHHQSIKGNNVVWCWIHHAHQHLRSTNICFREGWSTWQTYLYLADIQRWQTYLHLRICWGVFQVGLIMVHIVLGPRAGAVQNNLYSKDFK